jgi:hypothetical protein
MPARFAREAGKHFKVGEYYVAKIVKSKKR